MKNSILSLVLLTLLFSCQKDDTLLAPTDSEDLKSASATNYNKFKNAIVKRVEFELYCGTEYEYTDSIYINGVAWKYASDGFEYLMYKGLTHVANEYNDYFFYPLEFPADGYIYGIGFGNHSTGIGYYPFTANVQVDFPEKNYSVRYDQQPCFAIGDAGFASTTDSIRIVLRKKQNSDLKAGVDSVLSFAQMKLKLGLGKTVTDSVTLNSSLGNVATYAKATIYNWDYYGGGTTDIYGLENAGGLTNNLNFGDDLSASCSATIDIYLHQGKSIFKCSTSYSIFYTEYLGSRKQLHIYESQ